MRPAGRSLGRFVGLLLTWRPGLRIPRAISDAGHWNDWICGCGDRICPEPNGWVAELTFTPLSAGQAEVDTAQSADHLIRSRNQANLPSSGRPLVESRLKNEVGRNGTAGVSAF
jgi:hypothetical protein